MKTCGIFTVRDYDVKLPRQSDSIRIIPFGDVHRDSDQHAGEEWQEWLRWAKAQRNAFFVGMGDYFDGFSCSERAVLACDGIHDTTSRRMQRESQAWVTTMARELQPIAPRLIGLLGGNHYATFDDSTTSDQRLANALSVPFLGVACAIRIKIEASTSRFNVDLFAHHGRGSARTVGGGLSGVQKLTDVAEADIYLMGDDHKAACSPIGERLRITNGYRNQSTIRARTPWVARTGSFTKGYERGLPSYVVDRALPPTTLGFVDFEVRVRGVGHGRDKRRELLINGTTRLL